MPLVGINYRYSCAVRRQLLRIVWERCAQRKFTWKWNKGDVSREINSWIWKATLKHLDWTTNNATVTPSLKAATHGNFRENERDLDPVTATKALQHPHRRSHLKAAIRKGIFAKNGRDLDPVHSRRPRNCNEIAMPHSISLKRHRAKGFSSWFYFFGWLSTNIIL